MCEWCWHIYPPAAGRGSDWHWGAGRVLVEGVLAPGGQGGPFWAEVEAPPSAPASRQDPPQTYPYATKHALSIHLHRGFNRQRGKKYMRSQATFSNGPEAWAVKHCGDMRWASPHFHLCPPTNDHLLWCWTKSRSSRVPLLLQQCSDKVRVRPHKLQMSTSRIIHPSPRCEQPVVSSIPVSPSWGGVSSQNPPPSETAPPPSHPLWFYQSLCKYYHYFSFSDGNNGVTFFSNE